MNDALLPSTEAITLQDLQKDGRFDVIFSYSLHACKDVCEGVRIHLVLKFKYDDTIIEPVLMVKKPDSQYEKRYGDAHRIFPYCIFNALAEEPVSWTYQNTNGRVYERIELYVLLTKLEFDRYYPQVLSVVCLKIGTDGTAKTGLVNLLPEMNVQTNEANVDVSCFKKETSDFTLDFTNPDNFTMKTYVRDLRQQTLGNLTGIYTRVYVTFVFEDTALFARFRSSILSCLILNTLAMVAMEESTDDASGVGLAIVFLTIGLLFCLPHGKEEFNTASVILIAHCLYELLVTCMIVFLIWADMWQSSNAVYVVGLNLLVTLLTAIFKRVESNKYARLHASIGNIVQGGSGLVGSFQQLDSLL